MALSKEEKLKIKQAYEKEWRNYQRRIRNAENKGIVIPEKLLIKKVKNPGSWATVEKLKNVTFREIKIETARSGGGFYLSEVGEIVPKKEADIVDYTLPTIPKYYRGRYTTYETDPNAPLTFKEYSSLAGKLEHLKDSGHLNDNYEDSLFGVIRSMRGKSFNEDNFLYQEEKYQGYLARDPNRPLETEEIDYIKDTMEKRGWDLDDRYSYQKIVDSMRGIMPNYDQEQQMYNEWNQEEPAFAKIEESDPNYEHKKQEWNDVYKNLAKEGELPKQSEKKENTVSAKIYEGYIYNAFYAMVHELTFISKFADRNRDYLLRELERLASNPSDFIALNRSLEQMVGKDGSAFDVELMYKTQALAAFIFKLERLMMTFSVLGSKEEKNQAMNEAEANLQEAQENIVNSEEYE